MRSKATFKSVTVNMKVAIVCGAGIMSGKEIMTLELGQGLREAGAEIHFVTSNWGSGEFGKKTEVAGFPTYRLWLGFISTTLRLDCIWMTADQIWHWPSLFLHYRRFLRRVNPTKIVHTNWQHVLLMWPLLRPDRDLFWLHEVIPNSPQYRHLFRRLAERVDRFVGVSNAVARSLTSMGVPKSKTSVIYNGLMIPSRGRQKQPDGILAIGIVGQVGSWKGHEDLLNAFANVLERHPETQLHIFGNGSPDYEALLRRRASELRIERKVIWRGFVEDRSAIYGELSILIVPSRSEDPLPTTAIEAAFFGIPVIASRRGGLPEIVEDQCTGYLFEAGDTATLANLISNLLGDKMLRDAMGKNAIARANSLFSRERFVRDFVNLLEVGSPAKQNGHSIDNAA
jgi:glycosyltransferase involved in cell wall biosynthesis